MARLAQFRITVIDTRNHCLTENLHSAHFTKQNDTSKEKCWGHARRSNLIPDFPDDDERPLSLVMIPTQPFSTKLRSEDRFRQKDLAQLWDCCEGQAHRTSIAIVHQMVHDHDSSTYPKMIEIARRALRKREQARTSSSQGEQDVPSTDDEKTRREQQSIIIVINSPTTNHQNKSEEQSNLIQGLSSAYNEGRISKDELVQKLIQLLEAAWLQELFTVMSDLCSRYPGRYRYENRDDLWKDAQERYLAQNIEVLTSHLDVKHHQAAITRMIEARTNDKSDARSNHAPTHRHAKT